MTGSTAQEGALDLVAVSAALHSVPSASIPTFHCMCKPGPIWNSWRADLVVNLRFHSGGVFAGVCWVHRYKEKELAVPVVIEGKEGQIVCMCLEK